MERGWNGAGYFTAETDAPIERQMRDRDGEAERVLLEWVMGGGRDRRGERNREMDDSKEKTDGEVTLVLV